MEVKLIELLEYDSHNGGYNKVLHLPIKYDTMRVDKKDIFINSLKEANKCKINNAFFIMHLYASDENFSAYTVRVVKGKVIDLDIISPNNIDKEMLIDAILGTDIPINIKEIYKDRIIDRLIREEYDEDKLNFIRYNWSNNTRDHLFKMNPLRLKELYEKIKGANMMPA